MGRLQAGGQSQRAGAAMTAARASRHSAQNLLRDITPAAAPDADTAALLDRGCGTLRAALTALQSAGAGSPRDSYTRSASLFDRAEHRLNQPLPGPGPGGALADGARWTSAGRALKPPPHEVASVLGAAGDQSISLMRARIRALPAEFTLVMVTVRAGRYDGSPSHPAGDFGSLAARP